MDKFSYISNAHGHYLDELYSDYKNDPNSIDESWKKLITATRESLDLVPHLL